MKTAYYLRVSSKVQDTKSPEADIHAHAAKQADAVFYRDKFTGKGMNRPGWSKLWAEACAGKVDKVVVWRLDRLGRTVAGLSQLFAELQERKIGLVSLRDGLDLNTAAGRLMAHVLASVAAYELEVKCERQLAGIEEARRQNGGKCPWGGRKPGTRVKVTEELEKAIWDMTKAERPIAEIDRVVKVSRRTVYTVLKRRPSRREGHR
jgi:DNA invertase Pin-like site-specific DNA recombinase